MRLFTASMGTEVIIDAEFAYESGEFVFNLNRYVRVLNKSRYANIISNINYSGGFISDKNCNDWCGKFCIHEGHHYRYLIVSFADG